MTSGAAELQECFDEAAAALGPALGQQPVVGVVAWQAPWCGEEACGGLAQALAAAAPAYAPIAAFFTVNVEASSANTVFALEKVMRKPESRRAGGLAAAGAALWRW